MRPTTALLPHSRRGTPDILTDEVPATPPDGLPQPRRLFAVVAISLGSAMATIDTSIAYVALPRIAAALGITEVRSVLVVAIYQLTLVMTMLPLSVIGDRVGHKRLYLAGISLFLAACPLLLVANNLWLLLAIRAVQAVGAAAGLSVCPALIRAVYPRRLLGVGLGSNSMVSATGFALAPILGGALVAIASWHWVFVSGAPLALVSLVLGVRALPDVPPRSHSFDRHGAILCAVTFGLVIGGLQLGAQMHEYALGALCVAGGAVAATALIRWELRIERPILPVDLLRQGQFARSSAGAFLTFVSQTLIMISLPLVLQHRYGFTPTETGLAMAPWAIVAMPLAPLSGMLADRIAAWKLGLIGMVIGAAGMATMTVLPDRAGYFDVGWRMALTGFGFNLFYSPSLKMVIEATPAHRTASAGAMFSTTRLSGHAVGATVLTLLFALGVGLGPLSGVLAAGLALLTALICLAQGRAANGQT
jgi:DHA2 family multidrug resistance protein-like MFS transporter